MATLYTFYYVEKETGTILLYAYTEDKELAKSFQGMRKKECFRLIKKKFHHKDVKEGIFFDPIVQEIYNKRSTRHKTKRLDWHPLTDGIKDYIVPLTYTEVAEITARVQYLEEISNENKSMVEKSLLKENVKKLLLNANKTFQRNKDNELYSVINTLKIFLVQYDHMLNF